MFMDYFSPLFINATMAPQPSGGTSAAAKPPSGQNFGGESRCRCCPYGFHIDLDFVKFAENVASGMDYAQKWNTQPRRVKRRRNNNSVDGHATAPRTITRDANSFDTTDEWLNAASPMESNMSHSTIGFYSGAEDELPTQDIPSFTNYLAKNRSDSMVARLVGELNGIDNARKPPFPPPLASSTPYPGQEINHKPQASWHGATSRFIIHSFPLFKHCFSQLRNPWNSFASAALIFDSPWNV